MRVVKDLASRKEGQPNGEKQDEKKRPPKRRRYHRFTLPYLTVHHIFFFWKATRTTKEREEEGKSRHFTERGLRKPPTPHQTERKSPPVFLPFLVVPCLCLSLCGGSSSLSFVHVVVSHSTLSFLMVPVSLFITSTEGTNHHHHKRTREKEHH